MRSTWSVWTLVSLLVFVVPVGGMGLAVGCSSSSAKAVVASDAGDASTADVAPDVSPVDAGPDVEQDPDVYPSSHHAIPQLDYNGGPILQHAKVVTITFAGNTHREALRDFDHFIVTTDWWKQTVEGFCVDAGPNAGCVGDGTAAAPDGGVWLPDGSTADAGNGYLDVELGYDFSGNAISDQQIQSWLQGHIEAGDFPAADAETLYVIFFPTSTTISLPDPNGASDTSCVQFSGYHGAIGGFDGGAGGHPAYAVLPYCDYGIGDDFNYQQLTFATSHELAEAVTDPQVNIDTAFYLTSNDAWLAQQGVAGGVGGECGDMCFFVSLDSLLGGVGSPYDESGYNVTRIWSNSAAAASQQPCQPWSPTYYGAALRTVPQPIPADGNHMSDGYVFVKRGQSVNVVADVFSAAPLPHDLLLYTGVPKQQGATSPSDLDAPPDSITVATSAQQVHNGDGVTVTFSVPSKAATGDYWMVIRAVLESDDYNDWPVIVHVE